MKHQKAEKPHYENITMPKNTGIGLYIGVFSFMLGFAVVWYMWWLALASVIGIVGCLLVRLNDRHTDTYVSVEEIERIETESRKACQIQ